LRRGVAASRRHSIGQNKNKIKIIYIFYMTAILEKPKSRGETVSALLDEVEAQAPPKKIEGGSKLFSMGQDPITGRFLKKNQLSKNPNHELNNILIKNKLKIIKYFTDKDIIGFARDLKKLSKKAKSDKDKLEAIKIILNLIIGRPPQQIEVNSDQNLSKPEQINISLNLQKPNDIEIENNSETNDTTNDTPK
jgi:hypothetical protein